jgi:hypothetical protein
MEDWRKKAKDSLNTRSWNITGKALRGDPKLAAEYLPLARVLLGDLENRLALGGVEQGARSIKLSDGTIIRVIKNGEVRNIEVYSTREGAEAGIYTIVGGFIFTPLDSVSSWPDTFLRTVSKFYDTIDCDDVQPFPTQDVGTNWVAKQITWRGTRQDKRNRKFVEVIISWDHGMPCRYRLSTSEDLECSGRFLGYDDIGEPIFANSGNPNIYVRGRKIDTPYPVVGAGQFDNWLLYVSYIDLDFVDDPNKTYDENHIDRANANAKRATFFKGKGTTNVSWEVVGYVEAQISLFKSPWFFSPDGTKAATVLEPFAGNSGTCYIYEVTISEDDQNILSLDLEIESKYYGPPVEVLPITGDITTATTPGNVSLGPWLASTGSGVTYYLTSTSNIPSIVYNDAQYFYNIETARCGSKIPPPSIDTYNAVTLPNNIVYALSGVGDYAYLNGVQQWYAANLVSIINYDPGVLLGIGVGYAPAIFDDYIDNQCAPVEGIKGRNSFLLQRETTSSRAAVTTTYTYPSSFNGGRLVAVDYGFDNERLLVEQKLRVDHSYYKYSVTKRQFKYSTVSPLNPWDVTSGPKTYNGWEWDYLNEWHIDIAWEFLVNDKALVTASGKLSSGDSPYKRVNKYRTDLNNEVFVWEHTYAYEIDEPTQPNIISERVWLLDADARTESVIYNHEKIVGTTDVPDEINNPLATNFHYYAHLILAMIGVDSYSKNSYIVAVHKGNEVGRVEVEPKGSEGFMSLLDRGIPTTLMPRMFSGNDVFENFISDIFIWEWDRANYYEQPIAYRTWMVTPYELRPTTRQKGSLTVRKDSESIYSTNDKSIVGITLLGDDSLLRDPNYIFDTLFDEYTAYDITQEFLAAVVEENKKRAAEKRQLLATETADLFRLSIIRAF